jgi:hypothetical protein
LNNQDKIREPKSLGVRSRTISGSGKIRKPLRNNPVSIIVETPVQYEGAEIGTVQLNFVPKGTFLSMREQRKSGPALSEEDRVVLRRRVSLGTYILYIKEVIEKDIQIALRSANKELVGPNFPFLVHTFYMPGDFFQSSLKHSTGPRFRIMGYENRPFLIEDEKILNMIELEGPLALRQGDVQYALDAWLAKIEAASEKMGKLKDALIKYAIGSSDKPFKLGRPKAKAIQASGQQWISDMYKEITNVLKIAKRHARFDKREPYDVRIDQAYKEYIVRLEEEYDASTDPGQKLKERIEKLNSLLDVFPVFNNPLTAVISSDEDLKSEFNKSRFEPNNLAKEIVAKLLSISISRLEKHLYSKK